MSSEAIRPARDWPESAKVWLVLDRAASAPRSILETTELAVAGAIDAVVCRLKDLPDSEVLPLAGEVRRICSGSGTRFVMSHHPGIAARLGADAVQVGIGDPAIAEVRQTVGAEMAIGYSAHSIDEANLKLAAGADYVFLGPIFATPAKLKYGAPLGLDTARRAVREVAGTLVCIGGISADNLPQLVDAGVTRVAAITALQHDCDPGQQAAEFRRLLAAG